MAHGKVRASNCSMLLRWWVTVLVPNLWEEARESARRRTEALGRLHQAPTTTAKKNYIGRTGVCVHYGLTSTTCIRRPWAAKAALFTEFV